MTSDLSFTYTGPSKDLCHTANSPIHTLFLGEVALVISDIRAYHLFGKMVQVVDFIIIQIYRVVSYLPLVLVVSCSVK